MYAKIFSSLWEGTLCGKASVQLVFIYLLANADSEGFVDIHPTKISGDCGLPEPEVRQALDFLEKPDPESRSPAVEGARIERIHDHRTWGWAIVNYLHYRNLRDTEVRRSQTREAVRRHRANRVSHGKPVKAEVSHGKPVKAQEEEEVEVEVEVEVEESKPTPLANGGAIDRGAGRVIDPEKAKATREWATAFQECFWTIYPRRVKKAAALKAWMGLMRGRPYGQLEELLSRICNGVDWCITEEWKGREVDKIPHASTFLNAQQWEDAFDETDKKTLSEVVQ